MFQDERINKESGRIYRNCILFSLVIILMICIVKFIYYASIKEFQFPYIIAEVVLLLDSIAILGIGELHLVTKIKDELFYYKRYKYYKKAILVYLSIGLLGFAIALPFEYNNHFMDISSQSLLIHLESFGFLFLVFSFKRARINFNYSFIEENNTIYWKKVAWNIFKLFLLHIVFLVVSLIFNIVIVGHNYLNIFKFFAVSFLSLAFIYILISFVERVSNDCIVNEKKNNALLIVGGLTLFIYFVYFISQLIVLFLQRNLNSSNMQFYRMLYGVANHIHLFYMPCFVWLLTFAYCNQDKNKPLDRLITLFVILALLQLVIALCNNEVLLIIMYNYDLNRGTIKAFNAYSDILSVGFGVALGICLSCISYQIFLKTNKYNWWFVLSILWFLNVILKVVAHNYLTQFLFVICSCLEMAVIILVIVFLKSYIENKNNQDESSLENKEDLASLD